MVLGVFGPPKMTHFDPFYDPFLVSKPPHFMTPFYLIIPYYSASNALRTHPLFDPLSDPKMTHFMTPK